MAAQPDLEHIRIERDGDVLVVTIDRDGDDLNRVDGVLHENLSELFSWLRRAHGARAILLTGHGDAFSAGGDFSWFPTLQDPDAREQLRVDARQLIWDLLDIHLPIVCAVNGHAVGLGASIALLCDTIFMAESATLSDPHVNVGLVAGDGGTIAWPLAVGPARAKRYLLTGDSLTAAEAERLGLVTDVVADEQLHDEALDFARRLSSGAPLAIQYTKTAINSWIKQQAATAFDQAVALEITTLTSNDHQEALEAIRERRPPEFRGI